MATILSGKELSQKLLEEQKIETQRLISEGVEPGLAVVLVGEDPASEIYVRNKGLACEAIGTQSTTMKLPGDVKQDELLKVIDELNANPAIHGILVQLPLPRHINEDEVLLRILPEKDVDGFHILNAGMLFTGLPGVKPCTPKGILYMLKSTNVDLSGKHAVVIGRSNIVGKPIAMMLLEENCTVTICHSRTKDLPAITRQADIVVVAIGKARFLTADMVKEGAMVIDVGINRVNGKVVGDVDFDQVQHVAGYITPVPGGVGKMTISMLMQNTLEAACRAHS